MRFHSCETDIILLVFRLSRRALIKCYVSFPGCHIYLHITIYFACYLAAIDSEFDAESAASLARTSALASKRYTGRPEADFFRGHRKGKYTKAT